MAPLPLYPDSPADSDDQNRVDGEATMSFWDAGDGASPALAGSAAKPMVQDGGVLIAGNLLKENPGKFRLSQYQRRYIALVAGQLHWWADEAEAQDEGITGSRGCVDFACCSCQVVEDSRSATAFFIRPLDLEGWRMQRLTGAKDGRVLSFDAKGSSFGRSQWVRAIRGEIVRLQHQQDPIDGTFQTAPASLLSVDDFLSGKAPHRAAPKRTVSSPNRARNLVYDREGLKLRSDTQRKSYGVPSLDSVLQQGDADLYIGDMVARNSPEALKGYGITRVVDCLEP